MGKHTSLALDSATFPVISYYDEGNTALKVLHCGNHVCSAANTTEIPDNTADVGESTWLVLDALDATGKPVVSYFDATSTALKVLHCNDVDCTGGDEEIETPHPSMSSSPTSLTLDSG